MGNLLVAFRIILVPEAVAAESTFLKRRDLGVGSSSSGGGGVCSGSRSGGGESKCELCKEPDHGKKGSEEECELHCGFWLGDGS